MPPRYRRPVTAAEKARREQATADKLAALHERLAEQVAALRSGEDWRRWLDVGGRFHTYSFNNTLLLLAQKPDATHVAGYNLWQELGRQVTKGEQGLMILAPVTRRSADAAAAGTAAADPVVDDPAATTGARHVVGFRPRPTSGTSLRPPGSHCRSHPHRSCWPGRRRPGCGRRWPDSAPPPATPSPADRSRARTRCQDRGPASQITADTPGSLGGNCSPGSQAVTGIHGLPACSMRRTPNAD
jgi:hypothetical protein